MVTCLQESVLLLVRSDQPLRVRYRRGIFQGSDQAKQRASADCVSLQRPGYGGLADTARPSESPLIPAPDGGLVDEFGRLELYQLVIDAPR